MQLKSVKNAHSKTILTQYSVQQKMKNLLFASGCDFMVEAWNYINYAGKMVICIVMKKRKKEYNGRAANEFSSMGRWTKAAIRHGLWNLDTLAIIKKILNVEELWSEVLWMSLTQSIMGRSSTTLTKLWLTLTTYLPLVDIGEGISLLLEVNIRILLTFLAPPTYLVLST